MSLVLRTVEAFPRGRTTQQIPALLNVDFDPRRSLAVQGEIENLLAEGLMRGDRDVLWRPVRVLAPAGANAANSSYPAIDDEIQELLHLDGIRAVQVPSSRPPLRPSNALRRREPPTVTLARSLIAVVSASGDKIWRGSRAGLRAAIEILCVDAIEPRDVASAFAAISNRRRLPLLCAGGLTDDSLWLAAKGPWELMMSEPVTPETPATVGRNLAIVEALL